jgi:hypothetical protein
MPDDAFIAEVARLRAAAETLCNIETACVQGIPREGLWPAASTIVAAYESATALPSPILMKTP